MDIVVPESEDAIALAGEPLRPRHVAFGIGVLSAIELDDELCLRAIEIHHERADWLLTPEAKTVELLKTQARPEAPLGVR